MQMMKIIGAVLTAAAVALAPTASASPDEADFVRAVRAIGVGGTDANIITDGESACRLLAEGKTPVQAANIFVYGENFGYQQAIRFVQYAQMLLCAG
jgi:hypothetical protein